MKFNEFWAWIEDRADWKKRIEMGYGFSETRWKFQKNADGSTTEVKIKDLNNAHLLNAITYMMRMGRLGQTYAALKQDAKARGIDERLVKSAISKGVAQRDQNSLGTRNRY